MHSRDLPQRAATAVRTRWAVSIVDEKRIIRPETGDVHFLAFIAAFVGSCCSIWLAASRMDPPILLIIALFMRLVIFALAIPFACAALGVWVTGRMIPEWNLRRPVFGSACAAFISSVGTLLFVLMVLYV